MSNLKVRTLVCCIVLNSMLFEYLQGQSPEPRINIHTYDQYIDTNYETHIKEYIEFLFIPSISSIPSHKPDMERAAAWIVRKLQQIGMTTARTIPTDGLPIVFGSWQNPANKTTILIYAHYDVQPVKEAEWISPPFNPTIRDGKIFARGATDDKSGIMISIWAVEAMLAKNKELPVNVKFIFDGEEESGSPSFQKFFQIIRNC